MRRRDVLCGITGLGLSTVFLTNCPAAITSAVFFGDSITVGQGASSTSKQWSSLVARSTSLKEINKGISGTVLQNSFPVLLNNGTDRYQKDVVPYKPAKVFILYGLNDLRYNGANFSVSGYQIDLNIVVSGLISAGFAPTHITVGSPPYMMPSCYDEDSPFDAGSITKHQRYRDASKAVTVANGCKWADVYQAMLNGGGDSLISPDGVHPNDIGHQLIANIMLAATVPT